MAANSSNGLVAAIDEFQAGLTPEENGRLVAQGSKPDATSIVTFMTQIDNENAHRRRRCFSSRLFRVLESIQGFSGVVDTFVSSRPNIAALVWGTVKFVIVAANNITSFFEKLSECFLRLGNYCPRYSEYQALFVDSTRLQESLCNFYATIINFCTRAVQSIRNSGTTLAQALWRPFEKEFGAFEDTLRKQNEDVREEIKLAGEQAAARERKAAAEHRNAEVLSRQIATKESQQRRLQKDRQRAKAERIKLLDKLSSHDYLGALRRLRKKRHGQTSSWLSESKAFKEWLEDGKSSVLWLSGILGSGKSTVIAAVVENLLSRPRKLKNHTSFFFCEYDNLNSLNAGTILGTLIRQCLSESTMSNVIEHRLKELFEGISPDGKDFESLLQDIAATSEKVIFVIDGFDECHKADRIVVLKNLQKLLSSSQFHIKLLLSSREDVIGDIDRVFSTCHQVTMNCEETRADILTYIEDMVEDKIQDGELDICDPQLKQDIQKALAKGANGMFLWVAFQVEDLCHQKCDADIRKTLKSLPQDLNETYHRILARIVRERNAEIVIKIFRWIAAAKRPLLLGELREAIAIEPGDSYMRKDRLVTNANNIVSWCSSLAVLEEEDSAVQFAHHSVKDFLLSENYDEVTKPFHFQFSRIDHAAGEICVTYLHFGDFERQVSRLPRQRQHVQPKDFVASTLSGGNNRVARYGKKFVKMVTANTRSTFDMMERLDKTSGRNNIVDSLDELHAEHLLLAYVQEFWMSHTADFTPQNTSMWELWKELVVGEHHLAVKPWTMNGTEDTKERVMHYILDENHLALITCLRNLFNSDTLPILDLSRLLVMASSKGQAQVVRCIIPLDFVWDDRRHELVNAALEKAAAGGHMEVAELLLIPDPYRNHVACDFGEALPAAAEGGHVRMVERSLKARSYVNSSFKPSGETALQAAVRCGHTEVVELLLTAESNVDISSIIQKLKALHVAAERGHTKIVEMLLTASADFSIGVDDSAHLKMIDKVVEEDGLKGRTALQAAAGNGHIEVVERLLTAKADVNASSFDGPITLQAAGKNHIEMIERILNGKADVNAKAHVNAIAAVLSRTALQAAAGNGHIEVVERLLSAKADVNAAASTWCGRTALQAAAGNGHIEMIERLLSAKADVNAAASEILGQTALQAAAGNGHIEMVERLLTAKADVNAAASRLFRPNGITGGRRGWPHTGGENAAVCGRKSQRCCCEGRW